MIFSRREGDTAWRFNRETAGHRQRRLRLKPQNHCHADHFGPYPTGRPRGRLFGSPLGRPVVCGRPPSVGRVGRHGRLRGEAGLGIWCAAARLTQEERERG